MDGPAVRIEGLRELNAALRRVDRELPKDMRRGLKTVADRFATSLRLPGSMRARGRSTSKAALVALPDVQAGFIEFGNVVHRGGGVGPGDSHPRRYIPQGRYVFPAAEAQRREISDDIEAVVNAVLRKADLL